MSRILVTGATGLIGSHLLRSFGPDHFVYALSRSGPVPGASHTLAIDLSKHWSTDDLPRDIDVVVHLAQSEHNRDFPQWTEDVFSVNTLSTVKLLDYARATAVKQFVLASSGGVYGSGAGIISEDKAVLANGDLGFYIGTRLCSELLSDCYVRYMNIICLRFFFVYGPGQHDRMLVPRLVDSVRSGGAVKLQGDVGLRLNPVYVEDAVQAVLRAMTLQSSHKVNVAGPAVHSLREMVEIIGQALGQPPLFEVDQAGSPHDLVADISQMRCLLWEPRVSFTDGLAAAIDQRAGA